MKKAYLGLFLIIIVYLLVLLGGSYLNIFLRLEAADYNNHGWEVKRNSDHKQPEIPSAADIALKKYNCIYTGNEDKRAVYLTIDLGYESGNTRAILDTLEKNNVKATFFVVMQYMNKNGDMVDRIVNEGHSLQNHTANYKHLHSLDESQIKKEIMDLHNAVQERYGISMKYLRTPYEEWSDKVLKTADGLGYRTVFWSAACYDWVEGKDADYIYKSIMDNYHNGAIILLHAVSKSSPGAIDRIIGTLKGRGYEFRVLDM